MIGVGIVVRIMAGIVARTVSAQGSVLCRQPVWHVLQTPTRLRGASTFAACSCKVGWSNYRFTFIPFPRQDYNATCMQCEAGKFKSVTTIPVCIDCAAGTYTEREGTTACTTCERGKYSAGGVDMYITFVAAETSEYKCCAAVEQLGSQVERRKQKVTPRSSFIPTGNRTMPAWDSSGYSRCQLPFSWTELHKVLSFMPFSWTELHKD